MGYGQLGDFKFLIGAYFGVLIFSLSSPDWQFRLLYHAVLFLCALLGVFLVRRSVTKKYDRIKFVFFFLFFATGAFLVADPLFQGAVLFQGLTENAELNPLALVGAALIVVNVVLYALGKIRGYCRGARSITGKK